MPANPFVPLDGHNTVNDMIDRINEVYQYYADHLGTGAKLGVFYEGNVALATSYTIPIGKNAMTVGPIAINSGVTVTVSPGSVWTIV